MTNDLGEGARSPLLPLRHVTPDLFICDIFDAAPKADMASMEHPIFSLSTKPDTRVRRYEHGETYVEVIPSVIGLATVHDRDVLIYCISQIIAALNQGRAVSQTIRLRAHDLLVSTNRMTSGEGYAGLKAALERLRGTTISTNIITGGKETFETFGLIEKAKIVKETRDGRMQEVEIKLSDWVFQAIEAKEVLTLNRQYFQLRKPLERRLYELARKHCGHQHSWTISFDLLKKKCGSASTDKEFRRLIRTIVEQDQAHNHMPDYSLSIADELVTVTRRAQAKALTPAEQAREPRIDANTFEKARLAAPGYDVQGLHRQWLSFWHDRGCPHLRNADAAFIGFCKKQPPLR